jgi:glycine cleavage system aminomethyltransferase T
LIAAGTKIVAGEKEVGEITSAASLQLPTGNKAVALGYIRREVGTPGREVTIGTLKATVVQLPVADGLLLQDENSLEQRPA